MEIAKLISSHPSIAKVAFTTNGYRLLKNAQKWRKAGITHINVSVDSLDPKCFHAITGHNRLQEVRQGIDAALDAGFETVKINVVLLKGVNDNEFPDYLTWAKNVPISIRFIELMQTGDNLEYFHKYHLSANVIRNQLLDRGWAQKKRSLNSGPAQEFTHIGYSGSIGLIAPYSKDFCKGCNRLRVTSAGDLRLCLFGEQGISLRPLLQNDNQKQDLKNLICDQLQFKRSSHFLDEGNTGITPHFASIGG